MFSFWNRKTPTNKDDNQISPTQDKTLEDLPDEILFSIFQYSLSTLLINKRFYNLTLESNEPRIKLAFMQYLTNKNLILVNKLDAFLKLQDILYYGNKLIPQEETFNAKQKKIAALIAQLTITMEFFSANKIISFTLFRRMALVSVERYPCVYTQREQVEIRSEINKQDVADASKGFEVVMEDKNLLKAVLKNDEKKIQLLKESIYLAKNQSSSILSCFWPNAERDKIFNLLLACSKTIEKKIKQCKSELNKEMHAEKKSKTTLSLRS